MSEVQYGSLREKIAAESAARRERYAKFADALAKAQTAGIRAGETVTPRPMTVYEADGLGNRPKEGGQSWYAPEGVCGFAWVTIHPGTSSFAKWLTKHKYASKSYGGGVQIWISDHGQSYERKSAHAQALATVLREELSVDAHAGSRLD
jgi:hypothetical protein